MDKRHGLTDEPRDKPRDLNRNGIDEEPGPPIADISVGASLVLPRSLRFLQVTLSRGAPAILSSYALIGAVMALGGLGYLLDRYLETTPSFVIIGLSVGACVGFYNLVTTARRK